MLMEIIIFRDILLIKMLIVIGKQKRFHYIKLLEKIHLQKSSFLLMIMLLIKTRMAKNLTETLAKKEPIIFQNLNLIMEKMIIISQEVNLLQYRNLLAL